MYRSGRNRGAGESKRGVSVECQQHRDKERQSSESNRCPAAARSVRIHPQKSDRREQAEVTAERITVCNSRGLSEQESTVEFFFDHLLDDYIYTSGAVPSRHPPRAPRALVRQTMKHLTDVPSRTHPRPHACSCTHADRFYACARLMLDVLVASHSRGGGSGWRRQPFETYLRT